MAITTKKAIDTEKVIVRALYSICVNLRDSNVLSESIFGKAYKNPALDASLKELGDLELELVEQELSNE